MMQDKPNCCNDNCNQGRDCPVRAGTHKPAEALHQIQEPEADIWPCVNIDVDASGKITNAKLYSPGLPAGNHDVYPVRVPYIDEHSEAWLTCAAELEKASPGFMTLGNMNGIECAVAAIRDLAARAALAATPAEKSNSAEFDGIKTAAPVVLPEPDADYKLVPVALTPEMKREFMDLLMDGIDIYVNSRDQIEIQTDAPRRIWKAVLALSPVVPAHTVEGVPAAQAGEVVYRWHALDRSGYCYGSNPPDDLPARCNMTAFYRQPDAYSAALHEISATGNMTATGHQFARHLQQIARNALAAVPLATAAPAAVAVPDALIADARRLAYVADQVRALEPKGSESDVYLTEAAHVFRACADRITALAATPEAAPVVLPEPVAAESRFTSFSGDRWKWCTVEHARAFGQDKGYEVRYLYTEQQVRAVLAAHGIRKDNA